MDKYSNMQPSTVLKNEYDEICTPKRYFEKVCMPLSKGEEFTMYYRNEDVRKKANEFHTVTYTLVIFIEKYIKLLKEKKQITKIMVDNLYRQVWLYRTTIMKIKLDEETKGFYISDNLALYCASLNAAREMHKLLNGKYKKALDRAKIRALLLFTFKYYTKQTLPNIKMLALSDEFEYNYAMFTTNKN